MTKGTVLVASPSAIGRQPEASGSSVPAWPARLAENRRFTTLTAWVEVMPTGLSSTSQPCTSRLNCCFRGRGSAAPFSASGGGKESVLLTGSLIVIVLFEILFHRGRAQQLFDALGFREAFVDPKTDVGRE